jgi:hypothetical protein
MATPLLFYGNSDDTFGEYGRTQVDHDNCGTGEPIVFRVATGAAALFVVGQYAPILAGGACWLVGVAPVEENIFPSWEIAIIGSAANGYSPTLQICAPADATVTYVPDGVK